jgi:NAD-dependent deacetylase
MDPKLTQILTRFCEERGRLVLLTGAGISAESGIPTFRGKEGYWTVGSSEYHPTEMATRAMFLRRPLDVWAWYLYRRGICRAAGPNKGHMAAAALEHLLEDRFTLITQNVDGLHLRAGNSSGRTYQIHGNIDFMRCSFECTGEIFPVPEDAPAVEKGGQLREEEAALLACPRCGARTRPHVLWFDECYDEVRYHAWSAGEAAGKADLLIAAGTSGATNLPLQMLSRVIERGTALVDINPEENPFSVAASAQRRGCACRTKSSEILPEIASFLALREIPSEGRKHTNQ